MEEQKPFASSGGFRYHSLEPTSPSNPSVLTHDIDSSSLNVDRIARRPINYIPPQQSPHSNESDDDRGFDGGSVQSTISECAYTTLDESGQFAGVEPASILQAVVFLEDAYYYRSINHKIAPLDLQLYRYYKSKSINVFRYIVIFVLHMLAFLEYPSSLTITSDLRHMDERIELPCWLTQCIEMFCLLSLLADNIIKMYLMSPRYFIKHKWESLSMFVVTFSIIDWIVSFSFGCHEYTRFRRIFRPFFIIQHSSLMKKIVNCLRRTVPEVASVLLLLFFHLFIFTLIGMLLFPQPAEAQKNVTVGNFDGLSSASNSTVEIPGYFQDFLDSIIKLLVLLTTANNPDVTLPAYSKNRFASLFFILYLLIGLYCFMNMLLAVIYNQFRGYFLNSMQRDLLRRRLGVRASFEVLRRRCAVLADGTKTEQNIVGVGVGGHVIRTVVAKTNLPVYVKEELYQGLQGRANRVLSAQQYQFLFSSFDKELVHEQRPSIPWCTHPTLLKAQKMFTHYYFLYFGIFISFINLVIIAIPLMMSFRSPLRENHAFLQTVNFSFVVYYLLEQLAKLWAYGWRRYLWEKGNIFDAFITTTLVIGELYVLSCYGFPYLDRSKVEENASVTMWNVLRVVNIFIMVRIIKIIPHIKALSLVITVLLDLMRNMKAFAGILVVIFYIFAIIGMELFHGVIEYKPEFANQTFECGTYEQLNYWANHFDDFFSSLVILWDVMVVNNWQVFLYVFKDRTSPWSYLFFIAWWLMSVIIIMNLFTALIMENFIMKWDRRNQITSQMGSGAVDDDLTVSVYLNNDVHAMFRDSLQEPADNELLILLREHNYLNLAR